jgi:hypothetical protein
MTTPIVMGDVNIQLDDNAKVGRKVSNLAEGITQPERSRYFFPTR